MRKATPIGDAIQALIYACRSASPHPTPVSKVTLTLNCANQFAWETDMIPIQSTAAAFNKTRVEFMGVRIEATDD